ncbi:MAG: CPBP family intramembrane glutamic endopeptidase [Gemmatimonadales bacterium]
MTDAPLSGAKAIGWTVAYFVAGFILAALAGVGAHFAGAGDLAAEVVGELIGFGLATYIIGVRVLRLDAALLRYREVGRRGRGFAIGLLVGVVPAALAMTVALIAGAGWHTLPGGWSASARAVGALLALLLPAAFAEELVFRGTGMVLLARAYGRWPAIIGLAFFFGAMHAFNPGATPFAVANIALAGVYLGVAFYLPGGIWTATGVHLGWNLTLAALGAPVSGLPFSIPYLSYRMGAPAWVTGGSFGPEGGAIAALVLLLAVALVARRAQLRNA